MSSRKDFGMEWTELARQILKIAKRGTLKNKNNKLVTSRLTAFSRPVKVEMRLVYSFAWLYANVFFFCCCFLFVFFFFLVSFIG